MTIVVKSSIKDHFETGDKPTQAQFAEWVDSCVFQPTGSFGVIETLSTASATTHSIGVVGEAILAASTTVVASGGTVLTVPTTAAGFITATVSGRTVAIPYFEI